MGSVTIAGIELDEKKQKIVFLASAVAGIAALALMMRKPADSGSSFDGLDAGMGSGGFGGGTGGGAVSSTDLDGIMGRLDDLSEAVQGGLASTGRKLTLNYELDNSTEQTATGSYSKQSGGGGFNIGGNWKVGGFSLGMSDGIDSVNKSASFANTSKDVFTNNTTAEGLNEAEITRLQDFFTKIHGDYTQRTNAQLGRDQQAANNATRFIGAGVVGSGTVSSTSNRNVNGQKTTSTDTKKVVVGKP